jgi:hypothetical protein
MHLVFPAQRLTLPIPDFRCLIRLAASVSVFHLVPDFHCWFLRFLRRHQSSAPVTFLPSPVFVFCSVFGCGH